MLSVDQSSESEDEDELHYDMEEDAQKYGSLIISKYFDNNLLWVVMIFSENGYFLILGGQFFNKEWFVSF